MRVIGAFTSPLLPDDYLGLVNPLWSARELRGRVRRIDREAAGAVTITIKPGWEWPGHLAGQYVRVGVAVDGRHHWRAYSLTSDPGRGDGCITITPKLLDGGCVSPFLCRRLRPGDVLRLGGVEGAFVLPDPAPQRLLMITAGSGVTPVYAMLRQLDRTGARTDVVHVHCARSAGEVIFGERLRALARRRHGYKLHERHTGLAGRLAPAELDGICPDWACREAFACGPPGLLAALRERWQIGAEPSRLHVEQFVPDGPLIGAGPRGCGGEIEFTRSGVRASSDGTQPILAAGEDAGAELPFGCRMGICHSCVGRLRSGRVRNLRTGEVAGQPGEIVQTCINAPEGAIEIEL
jgi:ferredoxin-NADP reductase